MSSDVHPVIMIATPCYGGQMTHVFVHSLLGLLDYGGRHGLRFGLLTAAHDSLVPRARNSLVATFIGSAATHLMFIDADIGFAPESLHRLVTFDEELVAGMYPVKNLDWAAAAAAARAQRTRGGDAESELRESALHFVGKACEGKDREERDGFVTASYAGAGFMLIKRSAIEKLVAAYPETKYTATHTFPAPKAPSPHQYNLFDCIVDLATGTYLSEDYTFCHRFRKIGGKVWLDTRSKLTHVGSYEFQGQPPSAIAETSALGARREERGAGAPLIDRPGVNVA